MCGGGTGAKGPTPAAAFLPLHWAEVHECGFQCDSRGSCLLVP